MKNLLAGNSKGNGLQSVFIPLKDRESDLGKAGDCMGSGETGFNSWINKAILK